MEKKERVHKSFLKVFDVLKVVAVAGEPVNQREIALKAGMNLPNAQRALNTLETAGLIERSSGDRSLFMLGREVASLAGALYESHEILRVAYPEMLRVRDEENISSALFSVYDGQLVPLCVVPLYADYENLPRQGGYYSPEGMAAGKALAAWFGRFHLDSKFRVYAEKKEKEGVLEKVIKNGFAIEEVKGGLKELSVPVRDRTHDICCAVSVFIGRNYDVEKGVTVVKALAYTISRKLGYGSVEAQIS